MVSRLRTSAELLPARRLLALLVDGTSENDLIRVTATEADLVVELNGKATIYPLAETTELNIVAGDGNDTIELFSTSTVAVSVDGGAGDDELHAGGGDWRANLLSAITLRGGLGSDLAILDDSLASAANIQITNPFNIDTQFAIDNGSTIFVDAGTPDSTVERIELRTGAEADDIILLGISSFTSLRVLSGEGDDSITVGNDFDSAINGAVTLDGETGANTFIFDDSADGFGDTYTFAGAGDVGTIAKNSTPSVLSYTHFSSVDVSAGLAGSFPNNQFFRVNHLPSGMDFTINAGSGDDALTIGTTTLNLAAIQSSITFNAEDGFDRLTVNDVVGADTATYTLTPAELLITGQRPIRFTDLQYLTVLGNAGSNLFDVQSTVAPTSVTLDGGAGDDEFNVGAGDIDLTVGNSISVIGGAGTDYLRFDDTLDDAGNDTYTFNAGLMLRAVAGVAWSTAVANAVEVISLLGSANNDTIRISSASPNTQLRINAGDGNDTIVADKTTDAAGAFAPVFIASGAGNDSLSVNSDGLNADVRVIIDESFETLSQLTIRNGGILSIAPGGGRVLKVATALNIVGSLDLNDQTLIVANGNFSAINALVGTGYNGGTWMNTGTAIVSTAAAQSPATDALATVTADSLGLPAFDGVATLSGDVIVRYTLAGDVNLDRLVGFDDLLIVAQNYNPEVGGRTWIDGNFNYTTADNVAGAVGFDDLLLMAQNYEVSLLTTVRRKPTRLATVR